MRCEVCLLFLGKEGFFYLHYERISFQRLYVTRKEIKRLPSMVNSRYGWNGYFIVRSPFETVKER